MQLKRKSDAQNPRSPEAMVSRISEALREALPGHDIMPTPGSPGQVRLVDKASGTETVRLNLGNLLAELFGTPHSDAEIEERIAMFLGLAKASLNPPDLDPATLFPALRHLEFTSFCEDTGFTRPGVGDCGLIIMQDAGDCVSTLSRETADIAGLSEESLWDAAQRNLTALLNDVEIEQLDSGMYRLSIENADWLGNSLLLLPKVLGAVLHREGITEAFLVAPTRGSVDFIDAAAPGAQDVVQMWMAAHLSEPHPQSELVFSFSPGDLHPKAVLQFRGDRLVNLS